MLGELKEELGETFGSPVGIKSGVNNIDQAYDPSRRQYLAPVLLSDVRALGVEQGEKVLGVADADLYAPGLNFVFGEADIGSGVAVISLYRLRQERYGLPPDDKLFKERTLKEAIHELGHIYGLGHCRDARCVMYFSNSLPDTDWKQPSFCQKCYQRILRS